jgi:hypothetical protein
MRFRCPSCRDVFPMPDGAWPETCPACGYDTSIPDREEVQLPAFLSPRVASEDRLYRDVERGSEQRVHLAAEAAGCDASDMASLKITNLQTGKGAEPIPVPQNPVTQRMAEMEARGMPTGFGAASAGLLAGAQVQSGHYPNAGARFQTHLRNYHGQLTNYTATGDNPSVEVMQPGYRRRA